eukprot:838124-Lingulodinium_polyedra.AAC.1
MAVQRPLGADRPQAVHESRPASRTSSGGPCHAEPQPTSASPEAPVRHCRGRLSARRAARPPGSAAPPPPA